MNKSEQTIHSQSSVSGADSFAGKIFLTVLVLIVLILFTVLIFSFSFNSRAIFSGVEVNLAAGIDGFVLRCFVDFFLEKGSVILLFQMFHT